MQRIPIVDVDYCQLSDWGYQKPTLVWGSLDVVSKPSRLCDGKTCPNLAPLEAAQVGRVRIHRESLGGPRLRVSAVLKGRIPAKPVEYLAGFESSHSKPSVMAGKGDAAKEPKPDTTGANAPHPAPCTQTKE